MTDRATKVYIVQEKRRWDPELGTSVPLDVTKAERHGQVEYLLPTETSPFEIGMEGVVSQLRGRLAEFEPTRDFLLLLGNPILIGLAVAVASEGADRLQFLQWVGSHQSYVPITAELE